MRIRHHPGVAEKLQKMPEVVSGDVVFSPGQWREYFGNNHPLHVELGMGKGTFITTLARQYPEINFIGVERVSEIIYQAGKKGRGELANLYFLHLDVRRLAEYFLPGEIARIYLNFSDPWPKKRHEKRRLTNTTFLKIYKRLLRENGSIFFKTDSRGFFDYSLKQFIGESFSVQKIVYDLHHSGFRGNILTEYEIKFRQKGYPICRCEVLKN